MVYKIKVVPIDILILGNLLKQLNYMYKLLEFLLPNAISAPQISFYEAFGSSILMSDAEVGKHFYWNIGGFLVHGQVLAVIWLVFIILLTFSFLGARETERVPRGWQNFTELALDFIIDIAKNQLGESFYREWLPFIGTLFLFIFGCNWAGAIIPLKLIKLPEGELAAPTNDINTTVALALLTSFAYFYAGLSKKGLGYFKRYVEPLPLLLPINILEDFTKPLSLSFRLFGNVLADELTITVLTSLVPLVVPLPIMLLGIFAGSVQALIFSTLAAAYIAEALE